jgi:hypothetical protein
VRRKLHGPVIGWSWGGDGFWCRDRGRDWRIGGRVLSPGGGTRLVLRAAPGTGTMRWAFRGLALRSLRTAPTTPTRHHPPETRPIPSNPPPGSRLRFRGPSSFTKSRCGSFKARQTYVGRQRRRRRRRQQAWCNPQRKQNASRGHEHYPSLRPANSDSHPCTSPQPWNVSPEAIAGRVGHPSERLVLFRQSNLERRQPPHRKS